MMNTIYYCKEILSVLGVETNLNSRRGRNTYIRKKSLAILITYNRVQGGRNESNLDFFYNCTL